MSSRPGATRILRRFALPALVTFVIALRFLSVFLIYPNNAPDEIGHYAIATALSHGRVLDLKEEWTYTPYPYSVYDPAGYLPGSIALAAASLFKPSLNEMQHPIAMNQEAIRILRLGQLAWFFLFLLFLLELTKDLEPLLAILAVALTALIPQITFVQTYLNTDSMGLFVTLYMIWALRNRKLGHTAFCVFLMMNTKMNYWALVPLPVVTLVLENWKKPSLLAKKTLYTLLIPGLLGLTWFVFNYFHNTRQYGSLLGFSALNEIYHIQPSRGLVFSWRFLDLSIDSTFGVFSWMSESIPRDYFRVWGVLLILGSVEIIRSAFGKDGPLFRRSESIAMGAVVVFNIFLHYYASYSGGFQPQGRYLFPAIIILMFFLTQTAARLKKRYPNLGIAFCLIVLTFMFASVGEGLLHSSTQWAPRVPWQAAG